MKAKQISIHIKPVYLVATRTPPHSLHYDSLRCGAYGKFAIAYDHKCYDMHMCVLVFARSYNGSDGPSLVDVSRWVWSQLLCSNTPPEADEVSEALLLKAGVMDMINPKTSQQYLRGAEGCTLQAIMVEGVEVRGNGRAQKSYERIYEIYWSKEHQRIHK
jgi:hypothetical protein